MPALKPQHEAFCQYYVTYFNAAEAARVAGYSDPHGKNQGYRLLRRPAIASRIAELRDEIAARDCLSLSAQLAKLETVYLKALRMDQPAAAARVIESEVALPGLLAKAGLAEKGNAELAELRARLDRMSKILGVAADDPRTTS